MAYNSNKQISGLEAKSTPISADLFVIGDTVDNNKAKKTTLTELTTVLSSTLAPLASPTFTGTVTTPALILSNETASTIAQIDASKNVKSLSTSTYPSLTELAYVKGVTSAIQTQLNAKEPTITTLTVAKGGTGLATLTANNLIVGNGTGNVTFIAPGTSGNVLTSNGTIWVSTTAPTSSFTINADESIGTHYTHQIPMVVLTTTTIQGWTVSGFSGITGSAGGVTYLSGTAAILTTPLPGSTATDTFSPSLTKSIRIKFRIRFGDTIDRKGFGLCITGANIYTTQSDTTNGLVRFILNGSTLYAHNSNGTATSTDISSGLTFTNYNIYEIVFTPGTDIKYYVNGTLKATHTTNLPTTGTQILAYGVDTNGREIYTFPPIVSIQN